MSLLLTALVVPGAGVLATPSSSLVQITMCGLFLLILTRRARRRT